jgi:hypothetical protein
MTPERNVDAALKARSACPMPPCCIGLGLLTPDFVRLRPARSLSLTIDGAFDGPVDLALPVVVPAMDAVFLTAITAELDSQQVVSGHEDQVDRSRILLLLEMWLDC